MASRRITSVTAFVDWNTQLLAVNGYRMTPGEAADRALDYVCRKAAAVLNRIPGDSRFDVAMRFYHGWYKGFEPTDHKKALVKASAAADFSSISRSSRVNIRPDIGYGDRLLSAKNERLHQRLGIHLPGTLRERSDRADKLEEKMVDSAIVADVVDSAHREPERWITVFGEDDDLVPAIYTAESALAATAKILVVRKRDGKPLLKLDGIWNWP